MWFKLSQLILRNRIVIISIIAGLTIFFGYFAFTSLEMDNKYGNMLPKKSPAQDDYLQLKEMFGEDGGALVLAIKTDKLYTEENFLMWKQLGDSIAKLDGVNSVLSERSEERRVGKECRSRWWPYHLRSRNGKVHIPGYGALAHRAVNHGVLLLHNHVGCWVTSTRDGPHYVLYLRLPDPVGWAAALTGLG